MANIRRNLAYNFLLSFSQLLLPLLSTPYIARVLDPSGIGKVGFIDSFTYYFIIIAEFGITTYGIREIARAKGDPVRLGTLVPELLTLHVASSMVTAIFYVSGVIVLWEKIGDARLVLFSVSFFVVNFFACDWYFIGREQFGFIALRSICVRLLGLLSIFILIRQPADYFYYYAIIAGSAILTSLWNNVALFRQVRFSFTNVRWRRHLRYVWVTYLISLLLSVPLYLDNVLLGLVNTSATVGLYAFSTRIVRIGGNLLTDSFLVFLPRIVALSGAREYGELEQKLALNVRFVIMLAVPMGMGLLLVADELSLVFFGPKFSGTSLNIRILALYPLIKGISLFLSNPVLIAHNKEQAFLKNLACTSVLFIVIAPLMGHQFDAPGACAALMITEAALLLANYRTVHHEFSFRLIRLPDFLQATVVSVMFIPVVLLVRYCTWQGSARLIFSITCCVILYAIGLLLLRNSFALQVYALVRGRPIVHQSTTRENEGTGT